MDKFGNVETSPNAVVAYKSTTLLFFWKELQVQTCLFF